MCLLVLAWKTDPALPLLLAGNREELHARPAAPLHWWPGEALVAGRDLVAGGSWLGAARDGRFAVITNLPRTVPPATPRSRGHLVTDFLTGPAETPLAFLGALADRRHHYAGFSMIAGNADEAVYYASTERAPRRLAPGLHGLGNDLLDVPAPRLARALGAMRTALLRHAANDAELLRLWADDQANDEGPALFIRAPLYGTRATTVLARRGASMSISEVGYDAFGAAGAVREFHWSPGA